MSILAFAQTDYSESSSIKIKEPSLAYVNITGVDELPMTKTDNLHAWFEYSDAEGNYFKKRIILNAQGASSLRYPKKNLSMDFCEDEWVGDKTTSIQIGNWVKQDAFHFKANWIDSFRGGLAVATSYKLYDDIVADEPHILERAGMVDYDAKALCHPDGFPCIISLNSVFQGIYAWQLKKHRKNMGMEKDNSKHVWFQLETYTSSFTSGTVVWEDLDIKNPKVVDDEAKSYIERLAQYNNELTSLSQTLTDEAMREEIKKRYDVTSVIDFYIHGLVTSNIDGFGKNANFMTYDGIKWFVVPYDLDETFGNIWINQFQFPAEWSSVDDTFDMTRSIKWPPFTWVRRYFWTEICSRYGKLRDSGVLTTDNIMSHLIDWNGRVGGEFYLKEYEKWDNCPSSSKTIIDDNWEQMDWSRYKTTDNYNDTLEYFAGQFCKYEYRIWRAKNNVKGIIPVVRSGYTDTEERVQKWISDRLMLEDSYLSYTPAPAGISGSPDTPGAKNAVKVIINNKILFITPTGTYDIMGRRYAHH